MSSISLVENTFFDNGRYWGGLNASVYNSGSLWSMKTGIASADLNWAWNEKSLVLSDRKAIQHIKKDFQQTGLPFSWWILPSAGSAFNVDMLKSEGFSLVGNVPSMLADLTEPSDVWKDDADISFIEVKTNKELDLWEQISFSGFDFLPENRDQYHRFVKAFDLKEGAPQKFFLACTDGEPVATSLLFLNGNVAGLYFITTLAGHRKKGFGLALTRKTMQYAKIKGARFASLQSSPEGFRVYQKAGFKEVCHAAVYSLNA